MDYWIVNDNHSHYNHYHWCNHMIDINNYKCIVAVLTVNIHVVIAINWWFRSIGYTHSMAIKNRNLNINWRYRFHIFLAYFSGLNFREYTPIGYTPGIGWWENFNRKALYLMVKTCKNHGSRLRFSHKPIHWLHSSTPPRRRGGCRRKGAQLPGAARLECGARGTAGLEATGGRWKWTIEIVDLPIKHGDFL